MLQSAQPPIAAHSARNGRKSTFLRHAGAFVVCVSLLYLVFPQLALQQYDGQMFWALIQQRLRWGADWSLGPGFNPLQGAGSVFLPINVVLMPSILPLALPIPPDFAVWLTYVSTATLIFASGAALAAALGTTRWVSVASGWALFGLVMLLSPHVSRGGPSVADSIAKLALLSALLARVGLGRRQWLPAAVFPLALVLFIVGDIAYSVFTLPALAAIALTIVFGAGTSQERRSKILAITGALLLVFATGIPLYAIRLWMTTARVVLADELVSHLKRTPWSSGLALHDEPVLMAVFLVALVGATLLLLPSEGRTLTRKLRAFAAGTLALQAVLALAAAWYWYGSSYQNVRLRLPPFYLGVPTYPMLAVTAAAGVARIAGVPSLLGRQRLRTMLKIAAPSAVLVIWRLTGGIRFLLPTTIAAAILGIVIVGRRRAPHIAGVVVGVLLLALALSEATDGASHGRTRERLGLVKTPLVRFLAQAAGITPGSQFRGYVEDYFRYADDYPDAAIREYIVERDVYTWVRNMAAYGTSYRTFGLNAFNIPTLSEYGQYISPAYYLLYTRLLGRPHDVQTSNYLMMTNPNLSVLRMLGARFIVTDRPLQLSGVHNVYRWNGLDVYEIDDPNLASFSPRRVRVASTVREVLRELSAGDFDPRRDVVIAPPAFTGDLVVSEPGILRLVRGGFEIQARSSGRSLVLLPVQFTHCWHLLIRGGDPEPQVVRANLAQTAVLFTGRIDVRATLSLGPGAGSLCRRDDLEDLVALRFRDVVHATSTRLKERLEGGARNDFR